MIAHRRLHEILGTVIHPLLSFYQTKQPEGLAQW